MNKVFDLIAFYELLSDKNNGVLLREWLKSLNESDMKVLSSYLVRKNIIVNDILIKIRPEEQ